MNKEQLSIEEKARAYDVVREEIALRFGSNVAEEIFSQFEMSEDEKIRQFLIHEVKETSDKVMSYRNMDKKAVLAYLDKQGEQKSAEWNIFDFRTWQYIVSDVLTKKDGIGQYLDSGECKKIAQYMQEEWSKKLSVEKMPELLKGEDYGIDGLWTALDILQKTYGKVEGYQTDDGILEHECAISAVKKLYEQKPAWSEEDKVMLDKVIERLHKHSAGDKEYLDIYYWLIALKDRVQPQPKQEWKPSDEQIELLREVQQALLGKDCHNRFVNFMYELKRLREE